MSPLAMQQRGRAYWFNHWSYADIFTKPLRNSILCATRHLGGALGAGARAAEGPGILDYWFNHWSARFF